MRLSVFLTASYTLSGQITIDRDNYPARATFIDTAVMAITGNIMIPTEGADQIWDYSTLMNERTVTTFYLSASNDENFPGALNSYNSFLIFQTFTIPSAVYETIDDDGLYAVGRVNQEVSYSITALTGGPNDVLKFPGGPVPFDGRFDVLKFPMTFQDEWTQTRNEFIPFEITVEGFGLDKVPGNRKRIHTQIREIVGYGQLTIPDYDNTTGQEMDVLLMKVKRSGVDSFFLDGAPAPMALLNAFGVVQGSTIADSFYLFYREDFDINVVRVNFNENGDVSSLFYRPAALRFTTSIRNQRAEEVRMFPNPAKAGQVLHISTVSPLGKGVIQFTDMTGKLIHSHRIDYNDSQLMQIDIPPGLHSGVYLYQIVDEKRKTLVSGRIILH